MNYVLVTPNYPPELLKIRLLFPTEEARKSDWPKCVL